MSLILALLLACGSPAAQAEAPAAPAAAPAASSPAAAPAPQVAPAAEALPELPADANPALLDPSLAQEQAPDKYRVRFHTTQGDVVVAVYRSLSPNAADRLYNLVRIGFFDDVSFFRVIPGFMAQFGVSGYPQVNEAWREARMPDDPVLSGNQRGHLTMAMAGPGTRTTQFFINFKDNTQLDGMGFTSFGEVVEGMEVVDSLYGGYGEGAPRGSGPDQGKLLQRGNPWLKANFPKLDAIQSATVE
ncbi:MAG: peptidylprolyl isomerase [Deltaproteobacteria bacterium]|nr:peptidylprolyl isomerase [Deltaproteobacteria bacterium]